MKNGRRLRCIFTLPLVILLLYFGAGLSNVLDGRRSVRIPEPGETAEEPGTGNAADSIFEEPEWIDFRVCRMLYDGLSDNEKEAYEALYEAVLQHKETVYIPELTADELSAVHAALKYDNPQLPCISDEFSYGSFGALYYVKMKYEYSEAECAALSGAMLRAAKEICAGCAEMDEYGRELYIHDRLIALARYEDGGINANSAAGILLDGSGVCAGYALAMKLMCDISGLDSCIIRGSADNSGSPEAHAWLIVKINGCWYHLDPTWDDPVVDTGIDSVNHTYFNLTTEWIGGDHSDFTLPSGVACLNTADNYYIRSGLYCYRDGWRSTVKSSAAGRLRELPCDIELRFEDAALYDEAYSRLLDGEINSIINEIVHEYSLPVERWLISTQTFEKMNSIHLIISEN